MNDPSSNSSICRVCGANTSPFKESCQTCHIFDQWVLGVETSNTRELVAQIKEEDIRLMVHFIRRLKEKRNHNIRLPKRRKTPQEFDFALQEIEKTTRGLELTSIEAVGVMEMVKQSFIEEMLYEDYSPTDGHGGEDMDMDGK